MDDLRALSSLVVAVGFLIGVILFIFGLICFKKNAENPQQYTVGKAIANLLTGTFLLASSFMYASFRGSILNDGWDTSRTGLSMDKHVSDSLSDMPDNFLTRSLTPETKQLIIGFVFLVGIIAFIRGLFLFREFGQRTQGGSSGTAMALFHVIGGIICMNIMMFSCIFAKTFSIPHICSS